MESYLLHTACTKLLNVHHFQILKSCSHALHHFFPFSNITGAGIQRRMVPYAHFLDTRFQLFSLEKCHKYSLVDFITLQKDKTILCYYLTFQSSMMTLLVTEHTGKQLSIDLNYQNMHH